MSDIGRTLESLEPSIRRMANSMSIKRVGKDALDLIVGDIEHFTERLCQRLIILKELSQNSTISFEDVEYLFPNIELGPTDKPCKIVKATTKDLKELKLDKKFRGKEIYKEMNCRFLTKAVVERLIRNTIKTQNKKKEYRISADALNAIIDVIQLKVVDLLFSAGTLAEHAKRITVSGDDVSTALIVMSHNDMMSFRE